MALVRILIFAVMLVGELYVQELVVVSVPRLHIGEVRKLLPVTFTTRFEVPCTPTFGLTLVTVGAADEDTVIVRVGGLGSVFPAVSVTVNATVYTPAFAKVTAPGLASELLAGEPPRKDHE